MKKLLALSLAITLFLTLALPSFAVYKGDVNNDGTINSTDALIVLKYSVGSIETIDKAVADMNNDGNINSTDALKILRISVGLEESEDIHKHNYITTVTNKTCKDDAKVTYTCDSCGDTYSKTVSPIALSMTFKGTSSVVIGAYATYTKSYIVNVSGGYGTVLLKYELYSSSTATSPVDTLDFTDGTAYQVSYKNNEDAINNYVVKITAKDEAGNMTVSRIKLGDTSVIEESIVVNHEYSTEWTIDKEATCADDGSQSHHCTLCGKKGDVTVIPAKGHDFSDVDDKCTVCGELIKYTEGLRFALINGDTEYAVTSIGSATDADIVIPRTYKDKPVTAIGESAFESCDTIKSVRLHSQITSIGYKAFYDSSLSSVHFADGLTEIGSSAFSNCKLRDVNLPNSVTTVETFAFANNNSLTSFVFSDQVTIISYWVFYGCGNLTTVTIPKTVNKIDERAFCYCENLSEIVFEATKAEWAAITKNTAWDVGTDNYIIHCTDGDLTKAEA